MEPPSPSEALAQYEKECGWIRKYALLWYGLFTRLIFCDVCWWYPQKYWRSWSRRKEASLNMKSKKGSRKRKSFDQQERKNRSRVKSLSRIQTKGWNWNEDSVYLCHIHGSNNRELRLLEWAPWCWNVLKEVMRVPRELLCCKAEDKVDDDGSWYKIRVCNCDQKLHGSPSNAMQRTV